jgi:hypothetical protein
LSSSAVLGTAETAELDKDWKEQAEAAVAGWICTNCDTEVEEGVSVCPTCETPRKERRKR